MNILELPKDLLIEIWSYVTKIEDIVRFGATNRRIQQLAFEVQDRDLVLTEYAKRPFDALRYIFSRDLRHLRKLSIGLAEQSDSWLNDHVQVLTTLHNLKKLRIRFIPLLGYSIRKEIMSTFGQTVCDIVKKMTWLEQLGTSFPKHTRYRELLLSHQKLTKLDVLTKDKGSGYNYLTQLRAIATPISTEDSVFEQILDLDNLTSLDISWSNITPEAAINLTRLTNLAKVNIGGLDISYDIIKKLPKLHTLIDDQNNFEEEDFESLNQMTQLTRLEIETEQRMIQTEDFSGLTNLRELQFSSAFWWPEAFDTFKYLTLLQIKNFFVPNELLEPARFPPLKVFEMTACDCEIPLDIFNIDSIEELRIKWTENAAAPVSLLQISRLTNLKSLRLARQFPKGLGKSLAVLPHLRNIWMYKIYQKNIEELKLVTQLCQLTYLEAEVDLTLSTIRQKLPFIVYKQG